MKQIVDFEQAKRLWELDIDFPIDNVNHITKYDTDNIAISYHAPTIGELIEWILERNDFIMPFSKQKGEPIDELVELAIKIKEEL